MNRRNKLSSIIVRNSKVSYQEAFQLISNAQILVNGKIETEDVFIKKIDFIKLNHQIIYGTETFKYILLNKPQGIESTLNRSIENNLYSIFNFDEDLFPIGRLDTPSEGLILLTNNGMFYKHLIEGHQEKEYLVSTYIPISQSLLDNFSYGCRIDDRILMPSKIIQINDFWFRVILTEGMKRQIRRIVALSNHTVRQLIRIRIDQFCLDNLIPGESREVLNLEMHQLYPKLIGEVIR